MSTRKPKFEVILNVDYPDQKDALIEILKSQQRLIFAYMKVPFLATEEMISRDEILNFEFNKKERVNLSSLENYLTVLYSLKEAKEVSDLGWFPVLINGEFLENGKVVEFNQIWNLFYYWSENDEGRDELKIDAAKPIKDLGIIPFGQSPEELLVEHWGVWAKNRFIEFNVEEYLSKYWDAKNDGEKSE